MNPPIAVPETDARIHDPEPVQRDPIPEPITLPRAHRARSGRSVPQRPEVDAFGAGGELRRIGPSPCPPNPNAPPVEAHLGMLVYNGRMSLPLDDRTLAHVQAVVVNKLRRRENFALTSTVDGAEIVSWIGPATPLEFVYSGNRRPLLNRAWLERLAESASSNRGLTIVPEPLEQADAAPQTARPVPVNA